MLRNFSNLALWACKGRVFPIASQQKLFERLYTTKPGKVDLNETFVLLHDENGRVLGNKSLADCQDIAKRLKKHLLQIDSPSSNKDWYKLAPIKEIIKKEEEGRNNEKAKKKHDVKLIAIGASIAAHDLQTKGKQIAKWLMNGIEVRVSINGTMQSKAETLVNTYKQLVTHLEPDTYQEFPMKPGNGSYRCTLRPRKQETTVKSKNDE